MFFLCCYYNYKTLGAPLCVHPTAGTVQPMSSELLCLGYTQSNTVDVHVRGSVLHLSAFLRRLLAKLVGPVCRGREATRLLEVETRNREPDRFTAHRVFGDVQAGRSVAYEMQASVTRPFHSFIFALDGHHIHIMCLPEPRRYQIPPKEVGWIVALRP